MRLTGCDEQCSGAFVLIAETTSRGAPGARSSNELCRDFLLVLDIIEVAKLSLQVTERGDEGPVSLAVHASSKK